MACNNSTSNICAEEVSAKCIYSEAKLPVNTTITKSCVNQFEVNEDYATQFDNIEDKIDVSEISSTCIAIPENATIAQIVALYETKICELDQKINNQTGGDIVQMNLDFKCLTDVCNNPITTQAELFQALIDQVCNLE